jgi:two-component system chemotaxis response regulator CheB
MAPNRIIAVGASVGGVESLSALVALLPKDIDAAVFIVEHLPPDYSSKLPDVLSRKTPLKAAHARDGEEINRGKIYVAPPDHHLLVQEDRVVVARGPKENRFRPSIDALFRSIAYEFGPRAIGIVLSGALDDGTSGLWSIKRHRGVTVFKIHRKLLLTRCR